MNLLVGKLYDPATAATGTTTTSKAITAFDSTNLRLSFTVPSHGMARVHIATMLGGGTTFPTVLLAVLSGTGIVARVAPQQTLGNTAVTSAAVSVIGDLLVTSMVAGESKTWDAAYGVELPVAATAFQWGGPNNTTADDGFGGFLFEVWDPQPLPTAAPAAVGGLLTGPTTGNVLASVSGLTAANLDTTVSSRMATYVQPTGFLTSTFPTTVASATNITIVGQVSGLTAANLDATITSRMASYTQPTGFLTTSFPTVVAGTTNITVIAAVSGAVGSVTGAVGSVTGNVGGNVIGTVAAVSGLTVANLDATVSSRLATAGYTAPDNTSIAAILVDTGTSGVVIAGGTQTFDMTGNITGNVSGSVGSVTGAVASVTAAVDADVKKINATTVTGDGSAGNPWGPA